MAGPIIPIFTGETARLLTFDLSSRPDPLSTSIADLLEYVAAKDPRAIGRWRELSAEEYARSFAVARSAGYGVIADLYEAFQVSLGSRETASEFAGRVMPLLKRKGWLGGTAGAIAPRLELIYDTNLRVSRASGRWARYYKTRGTFPYLRGVTARDGRVRRPPKSESDHTAFDGIILPIEHAFWQRWFPPLGFRCRCSVIQMTRSQLARWPTGITSANELASIEERLGEPIFAAPGSFQQQLAGIAAAANEKRIPGQQGLDMNEARARGSRVLEAVLIDQGIEELAAALNRIFGLAA